MYITKITVSNYRLLKDFSIDLNEDMSLVIGKNNTGKTSLLQILDKMLHPGSEKFTFYDLNLDYRKELIDLLAGVNEQTEDVYTADGIKLRIYIKYSQDDDLTNLGPILMDLDENIDVAVLGFDLTLSYPKYHLLRAQVLDENKTAEEGKALMEDFLKKNFLKYFEPNKKTLKYDKVTEHAEETEYKDLAKFPNFHLEQLISFGYIDARRRVDNKDNDITLSTQSSKLFDKIAGEEDNQAIQEFQKTLADTDTKFTKSYKKLFKDIVKKITDMGGMIPSETQISIISTLQQRNLLQGNTTVVYKHDNEDLPETFNGLGYLNLISMIFQIEIIRQSFQKNIYNRLADINLLIIEEPEAHTHPQMQYVFIKNIKRLLGIPLEMNGTCRQVQSIISTHSPHIVSECDFDDIKYFSKKDNASVSKNMSDLKTEYDGEQEYYTFLKHYLTLSRCELFFADKAIFIEGDTERILLPTIMKKLDQEVPPGKNELCLTQQNISIIEVGAYSQIFGKFINFIGLQKALVLTDLDCCSLQEGYYSKAKYSAGIEMRTSNESLHTYFGTKEINVLVSKTEGEKTFLWDATDKKWKPDADGNFKVYFQEEEDGYQARSFEDGFFHINQKFLKSNKKAIKGLNKNRLNDFLDDTKDFDVYDLAEKGIDSKSTFAADIVYLSKKRGKKEFNSWNIPKYIKDGLLWIRK